MSVRILKTESNSGYKWNITALVAMGEQDNSFACTPLMGSSNAILEEIFSLLYFLNFFYS